MPMSSIFILVYSFEFAKVGILSITTVEGRNLKSMELIGQQDPYCKLEFGSIIRRGKTIKKGLIHPTIIFR